MISRCVSSIRKEGILLPADIGWYLWPRALPPDPLLNKLLDKGGMTREERGLFVLARLPLPQSLLLEDRVSVTFVGGITFLGWQVAGEGETAFLTHWQAEEAIQSPLSVRAPRR